MATFKSFEEIEAWKEARNLTKLIRNICRREKVSKDFSFKDQITRAVRSVSANIAEGFESQSNAEFSRFLGYAKSSVGEVRSHLYDALDEEYVSKEEFNDLHERCKVIGGKIGALRKYIQSKNQS